MKRNLGSLRVLALTLAIFGMLTLSAGVAYGQAVDGNIVGTVVDSQGAVVVGAEVTATNTATDVAATTKTGTTGEYRFDHLLAGTYKVTAKATGFKTITEMVNVELNKTGTRNLSLTPGATSETVEVSGIPPTLDTSSAQIETTFSPRELGDLPTTSQGSGVINLALLDAGVASSGGIGLGTGPSVSGQRPRNNNYTVEGVDNNSKAVTGPLAQIPNDAVDQFTVLQNQFSPEFGHSSGGQFNQTVKSGSNTFHGRAYEYFQNRKLNAIDSLAAQSEVANGESPFNPRYDNNRFGGSFGGPIIKDKLFFFTNWEYNPVGNVTSSTGCGPTAAGYTALSTMAQANITQALVTSDPSGSTRVALPLNATSLAQMQLGVGTALAQAGGGAGDSNCDGWAAGFYTTPDIPQNGPFSGTGPLVPLGAIGYAGGNYQNTLTGVVSVDFDMSQKDHLRGRYIYEKLNPIDFSAQVPSFWLITPNRFHIFTLSEYHNFSPTVDNEVRLGFNHSGSTTGAGNFQYPGLGTYPNLLLGLFEGDGNQLGADPNAPQFGYQNFYQLVDNISWVKGAHNFKFGAEYREYISPQGFTQRVRGDYDYTTYWQFLTDQIPDYLAERSIGDVTYYGNQNMFYAWAGDDWRIAKNFTINLGLRYEFTQVPLSEKTWQAQNSISNVPGVITFAAPTEQKKNFLPRVGFAYSPGSSGNTSIRAGFSMAQDVLYDNLGLLSASPQVQQTCDVQPGLLSASQNCFWDDPTIPASQGGNGTGFLAGGGLPFATTVPPITDPVQARLSTAGYIPNQQLPYSETWTFGIQHIFAGKYTLESRYVGTRGLHLPVQARLNRQAKTSATEYLPMFFTQPSQATLDALTNTTGTIGANSSFVSSYANAGFTGSNLVAFMPWGDSKYNGLQTQLRRSFSAGLQLQAAWTWSHAEDNSTADVFSTYLTPRRAQDSNCFACDYGTSALDRRQRITLQALYDIPFFKTSDSWLEKNVLGNWEFAPVYTFQSPEYATVQSGLDVNGNGDSAGDRTYINPAGVKGTGSTNIPLTNTAGAVVAYLSCNVGGAGPTCLTASSEVPQYVQAGQFSRPNAGRNTLALPRTNDLDFTISKRINFFGERQSFEFQAQALNLLNHAQFAPGFISDVAPQGFTGSNVLGILEPQSPSFNQPKSVFTNHPRQMVLVLKYNF